MPSLLQTYDALFRSAFESAGFPPELGAIRESDKPDLPPFQCNGAMAAAGFLKKKGEKANPRDIAQKIIELVQDNPTIENIKIGGPGFINFAPTEVALSSQAKVLTDSETVGIISEAPQTIIERIFRAQGHNVIGDVHMGDWGLQMGHLISELEIEQPDLPYFDVERRSLCRSAYSRYD